MFNIVRFCLIFWVFVEYSMYLYSVSGALSNISGLCVVCRGFVESSGVSPPQCIPPPWPLSGRPTPTGPLGGRPPPTGPFRGTGFRHFFWFFGKFRFCGFYCRFTNFCILCWIQIGHDIVQLFDIFSKMYNNTICNKQDYLLYTAYWLPMDCLWTRAHIHHGWTYVHQGQSIGNQ